MKKRGLLLLLSLLLIAVLVVIVMPHRGIADLGGLSGDSDYGGSCAGDSDCSCSESSYDSTSGGIDTLSDGKCTGGDIIAVVTISGLSLLLVLVGVPTAISKLKERKVAGYAGAARTPLSELTPIEQYKTLDPQFSPDALKAHLRKLYVEMQDCCTKRDVEPIRPYFADALWQQFDRQVTVHRRLRRTNRVENISVLYVDLNGFKEDKGEDVIIAEIQTRILDYTVEDDTGALVAGSKTHEKIMTYEYALSRPIERRSKRSGEGTIVRICPNCGAELDANETVECPYCGSVVTFGDHDWTVYSIKGISQRTI